ncbi:hypothetical protein [Streptomyces syringium]|uniref:hypothetical protein n=1 Tax=Streptomyces syringium TaxID=76729 RepID=UPI0033B10D3C
MSSPVLAITSSPARRRSPVHRAEDAVDELVVSDPASWQVTDGRPLADARRHGVDHTRLVTYNIRTGSIGSDGGERR